MMKELIVSKRLEAICSFIKPGARLLDVGTDHAYVPLFLIKHGVISHAWASDVNRGPLMSAEENAALFGFSDRLTLYLSNGLDACECCENLYDHIVIAGMGGEMIFEIIDRSEYIKNHSPKLILQPMTMHAYLRECLRKSGFIIDYEMVVFEDGKFYTIILSRYIGKMQSLSMAETAFGKGIEERVKSGDKTAESYLIYQRELLSRIIKGKEKGNLDHSLESDLLNEIEHILP